MKSLNRPFAVGRTAEVYAWDEGTILKLYRDWCPPNWVEHEARIAHAVTEAGLPVPAAGDIVEMDGRRGILYERVAGPSMLDAISQNPLKLLSYARVLASLHVEMHRTRLATELPFQRASLTGAIESAKSLPEEYRQPVFAALQKLPDGDQLCHGDFHPGNVILSPRGPVVIDWMTAAKGHPAADVARTRLLLKMGDPPQGGALRMILLLGRDLYYRSYLQAYRQSSPGIVKQSQAFMTIQMAARLNEDIPVEREKLLKRIRTELS
jgi:uncharacterized protein (TIGR02172 family)